MKILNITQHPATVDQIVAGVVDLEGESLTQAKALLTFDDIPNKGQLISAAIKLAKLAKDNGATSAMIGGAPFFMTTLETAMKEIGIRPIYAFSVRNSVEQPDGNGGVKKVNIFRHVGFIEV